MQATVQQYDERRLFFFFKYTVPSAEVYIAEGLGKSGGLCNTASKWSNKS